MISDVEVLDKQVSDIQTKITAKEEEENQLNTEIDDTKEKLAAAQVDEDNQYAAMMKRIQYLYENGEVEYIDTLMSSASFTDMLNKSEYVEQISSYDQKQLNALIQTRQDIQDYEATLEKDLKEVESVKADLETEKDNLNTTITEKNNKIAEYSKDIDAQTAMVEQYQKEIDAADAEMAAIQKRLDEQRAAQQQSVLDYFYAHLVTFDIITVFQFTDAADIQTNRGIKLQRITAGCRFGIAEHHANLVTQLVDEYTCRVSLIDRSRQLTKCLGH